MSLIKKLRACLCIAAASFVFIFQGNSQSFKIFGTSDMQRVFADGYNLPPMNDSVIMSGMRGEIISGQIAVNSKRDLQDVTVFTSELVSGTSRIEASSVTLNFVGSIQLAENTPNQPLYHLTRPAPALFPEYLMEEKQLSIKARTWQPVWLTISIPVKAEAGRYSGTLSVRSGTETSNLPVLLEVFPFEIPEERHLDIVEWYNTSKFKEFYGIQEAYSAAWFKMLGKIAANFAEHRQNSFQVPMSSVEISVSDSGDLSFDFTRFDQVAQVFWNTGKMDILETGEIANFGKDRWASKEIYLDDYEVKKVNGETVTMEGRDVLPYILPALEDHLRSKGWLEKTIFAIRDEPSVHNSVPYNRIAAMVHDYAPDLKRFNALESTMVLDELELAVPKLDHYANWYDSFKKWQDKGHELWFYSVGIYQGSLFNNKTIDVPLIDSRTMHWLNYKYGATGYLHWGWNQWTDDPLHQVGMHVGDGWHVYPSKSGFMNSLRWEEMRNGIQDYEYLWMLENKTAALRNSLGSRFSWIDPAQRGREIASMVIHDFTDRTYDPEVINYARRKIVKELIENERSPQLYVQTNPAEGTILTPGSTVEVLVQADPGTNITVNGQKLPESAAGLYMEQFGLSAKSNMITVTAEKDGNRKVIIREFKIK